MATHALGSRDDDPRKGFVTKSSNASLATRCKTPCYQKNQAISRNASARSDHEACAPDALLQGRGRVALASSYW